MVNAWLRYGPALVSWNPSRDACAYQSTGETMEGSGSRCPGSYSLQGVRGCSQELRAGRSHRRPVTDLWNAAGSLPLKMRPNTLPKGHWGPDLKGTESRTGSPHTLRWVLVETRGRPRAIYFLGWRAFPVQPWLFSQSPGFQGAPPTLPCSAKQPVRYPLAGGWCRCSWDQFTGIKDHEDSENQVRVLTSSPCWLLGVRSYYLVS